MKNRYSLAKISIFGVTYLKRQNPYIVAWWSAAFPGFGHYMCNQYIRATLLTLTELIFNTLSHINEAIVYMFCGKFDLCTSILNPRWAIGYMTIYLYTIWDSFRTAVVQNKLYDLAEFENQKLDEMRIYSSEIQYIEQKSPFTAAFYSFFFPGLGQLYNHRFALAFYTMFWTWFYITFSHVYESIMYLVTAKTYQSIDILRPHWLMFLPSVIGGAMYEAFTTAINHNRLFRISQRQFLKRFYQDSSINVFIQRGGDCFLITGTFEHSLELEQALNELEKYGVNRNQIATVNMDIAPNSPDIFLSKKREHRYKAFEVGIASATVLSVVGISIGFILTLGPIFWGLFSAIVGFMIGSVIYLLINKGSDRDLSKHLPEVVVNVNCKEEQSDLVIGIMWKYNAITVGKTG